MDITSLINAETDMEKLRKTALNQLNTLYNSFLNVSYKSEVLEFMLENLTPDVKFDCSKEPDASIVITGKNEENETSFKALLYSIKQNSAGISCEVITVQNNINEALSKAKGRCIYLMSSNMFVSSGYLAEILNIMDKNGDIGIAGSKKLDIDGSIIDCGADVTDAGGIKYAGAGENAGFLDDKDFIERGFITGGGCLFRRADLEKIGGLSAELPFFYQSAELSLKLKRSLGLKTVCVPKSKIYYFKDFYSFDTQDAEKFKQPFLSLYRESNS